MRIAYVVQRYGETIAGGAEQHCREIARRMVTRGHVVDVLTTRATSYVDWADVLPAGESHLEGVTVRRFGVPHPRENERFNRFTSDLVTGRRVVPLPIQRAWMQAQGPHTPALVRWLDAHVDRYDVVVFFTYLYWPTWAGLRRLAGAVPTVLHPTVHDEPVMRLSIFDEVFRAPDAFAFSVPEEIDLVRKRFRFDPPGAVVGVGVDARPADAERFRRAIPAIGRDPYLLYVGRLDAGKGGLELYEFFVTYKQRHPSPLRLVYLGDPLTRVPDHPDVVMTGWLGDDVRDAAIAGALALAQPSFFESFSMVLAESFAYGRPALVQSRCAVTNGHAQRSGAALAYAGYHEFAQAVRALEKQPGYADELGALGRTYVQRDYTWDAVLDRYEDLLGIVVTRTG